MNKPWLKKYRTGIPSEITCDESTLIEWLEHACQKYPNNHAITCHKVSLTYSELMDRVLRVAQGLSDLGVKDGDRVAIILPNYLQYPISVFAVLILGACVVNINPLYTSSEIEFVVQNSQPSVVICLDMFSAKLNDINTTYGIKHIITSKIADTYPLAKRYLINFFMRYIAKVNPKLNYEHISWRNLFYNKVKLSNPHNITCNDLAFIQYTSATTGQPKGAMLLHRNIVANIKQVMAVTMPQIKEIDKQVVICALPLYHIFSLTANLLLFMFNGAEIVMIPNARNIKDVVRTMNNTPFTVFNSLDSLYHKLLEQKDFVNTPHPNYKYGICGGMATRQSVAEEWHKVTGVYPSNCYGLTEASPCVTMNYLDDVFTGTVGLPVPSTAIEMRDVETMSSLLAHGLAGVIFIRGPQILAGYWQNLEQTSKVLSPEGWFYTGDIGYIDENGVLCITSRVTEMIIVSGFNVYPAEIERVLDGLPNIKDVAVVGKPNEHTGEGVHAYIVFNDGEELSENLIIQHCRKSLTKYKLPHFFHFIDELPKTPVGKIDKKKLAALRD